MGMVFLFLSSGSPRKPTSIFLISYTKFVVNTRACSYLGSAESIFFYQNVPFKIRSGVCLWHQKIYPVPRAWITVQYDIILNYVTPHDVTKNNNSQKKNWLIVTFYIASKLILCKILQLLVLKGSFWYITRWVREIIIMFTNAPWVGCR